MIRTVILIVICLIGIVGGLGWYALRLTSNLSKPNEIVLESQVKEPHSKLGILRYSLARQDPDTTTAASILDIIAINSGTISGDKPELIWNASAVRGSFSEDIEFEVLFRRTLKDLPRPGSSSPVEVNAQTSYRLETTLDLQAYQGIQRGDLTFYLLAILVWSDSSLEKDWWWVTEQCTWQRKDFSTFSACNDHNITYKLRIPPEVRR